jgi:Amt family ammonium transporter
VKLGLLGGLGALLCAGKTFAEEAATQAPPGSFNQADNAWVLVCAALVLLMTGPGLALFYGGLVRRRNVLSTMMHSFFLMGLVSMLWAVYGYSLAFAEGNAFFGDPARYFMLRGVGEAPNPDYAPGIAHQTFMLFQLMFAIITPALISGAYAERVKFSAMVVFTVLWSTFLYFPLAHMVWGKGGLMNWAAGGAMPVLDFAGGMVVHVASGVSALVFARVLGPRLGYPEEAMPPHNLALSLTGAGLLWFGWFGFNAGSALSAGGLASSAFAATHFAAASAGLSWAGMEWIFKGRPSALGTASGIVAGLVAVTPAAGYVNVVSAMLIGLASGCVCCLACWKLKTALGYDDSLDAFGIHGVGGILGALLTGLFASGAVNAALLTTCKQNGQAMALEGPRQVYGQLPGVVITAGLAAMGTWIILKLVDATIGLRVSAEEELEGLDTTQHGERAYGA